MRSICLNGSDWTLTCYWQHQWRRRDPQSEQSFLPALPPVAATVPGGVHADLFAAGIIPDFHDGLNAAACEWINNRDWSFKKTITVPADWTGNIVLECDGLDHSGSVLINKEPVATFEGTHFRHRFDFTAHVDAGETFELEIIFDVAPQVDGVFGFTSKTRIFKPRFGYYWDWCTRIVNVGIWQDIRLVEQGPSRFKHLRVLPRVNDDLRSGYLSIAGQLEGKKADLVLTVTDPSEETVASGRLAIGPGAFEHRVAVDAVELWWPATHGDQPLYDVRLELVADDDRVLDVAKRQVGFKRVRWLDNPDAPAGAKPYLCEINGKTIFLRGINWVPLSPLYGTVTREQYDKFIRMYREMNANVLRVWGGAMLETPAFYELCDRHGLFVWQEFPLSSSGIDNWPPEDPEVIDHLQCIASEYIERRAHHACHLLWCGGNELQGAIDGGKVGIGKPVDESHPLMAEWQKLVESLDPGKRFQATSPSGPRFFASPDDFGKGIHHQTHGPWGNLPLDGIRSYYNGDDSLFRSETGAPGCSTLKNIEKHRGDCSPWPPRDDNPYWLVPAAAWIPWTDVTREFGPIEDDPRMLDFVVRASRYLQVESYRYAAEATRRRFPQCSGFIVWMGHDCVPLPANNSLIETDGATKPAYDALRQAFAPRHVSLKHERFAYEPGSTFHGGVWIHQDDVTSSATGEVVARLMSMVGETLVEEVLPISGTGHSFRTGDLSWQVPAVAHGLFLIELQWRDETVIAANRYLLSQRPEHPLQPVQQLGVDQLSRILHYEVSG